MLLAYNLAGHSIDFDIVYSLMEQRNNPNCFDDQETLRVTLPKQGLSGQLGLEEFYGGTASDLPGYVTEALLEIIKCYSSFKLLEI